MFLYDWQIEGMKLDKYLNQTDSPREQRVNLSDWRTVVSFWCFFLGFFCNKILKKKKSQQMDSMMVLESECVGMQRLSYFEKMIECHFKRVAGLEDILTGIGLNLNFFSHWFLIFGAFWIISPKLPLDFSEMRLFPNTSHQTTSKIENVRSVRNLNTPAPICSGFHKLGRKHLSTGLKNGDWADRWK